MQVLLETERCIIRPITMNDIAGMYEMDSDPGVHMYVGKKPVTSIEQSGEMIASIMQQYRDLGIGRWAVEEKATGRFIGWTGFKFIAGPVNGHANYIDFGYRFVKKAWGRGYATETGRAALHYGIRHLMFRDIFATTDVNNTASRHVLEKLGFRYTHTFAYDGEPTWRQPHEPTTWYELQYDQ
ncbi:GNAT family N-acetyltransferase [Nemorincola caseinilytica]|uniref:GNAT family N-acetyltransferase n=1 Tax=Nemorincola caseinilytica TaxID=2054315 RepID=A0ABP8NPW8_9BACT